MTQITSQVTEAFELEAAAQNVYLLTTPGRAIVHLPDGDFIGQIIGVQALGLTTHFTIKAIGPSQMLLLDSGQDDATSPFPHLETVTPLQNVYLTYGPEGHWVVSSCMGDFGLGFHTSKED